MKISGAVIQNRNITTNTEITFEATYKKHNIFVSSDHNLGDPKHDHLTRFNVVVTNDGGGYAVDSVEDCHNIRDAIRGALTGACLLSGE